MSSMSARSGSPPRRRRTAVGALVGALVVSSALGACATLTSPAGSTTAARAGSALEALETLPVKGRAPMTGYDREQFGPAWTDTDRNGCDTRNDVLARDLHDTTLEPGTRGCVVVSGTLDDPYSGDVLDFTRGAQTSAEVQIDHVVALGDAWQKGAQQLDLPTRTALANDPLNLLAVDGPLNGQKQAGDAATWLPPNTAFRCAYVARQVAVKVRYDLWVTAAERDASARVLSRCPDEPLPTGEAADRAAPSAEVEEPDEAGAPAPTPSWASCTEVREAGAAPIRSRDPGFEPRFDRDGDGTGCEG